MIRIKNNPLKFIDPDGRNPLLAAALIGAAIGAGVGAGVELFKQLVVEGKSLNQVDFKRVGAAAASGAIFGAVVGLTGGAGLALPLAQSALALATASVAGGVVQRTINGEQAFNLPHIIIDAAAGAGGALFASVGQSRYLSSNFLNGLTQAQRAAAYEAVEDIIGTPVAQMPTLARPVFSYAVRQFLYHGPVEGAFVGGYRGSGKAVATFISGRLIGGIYDRRSRTLNVGVIDTVTIKVPKDSKEGKCLTGAGPCTR